jgi:hypothetical protein
MLVFSLSIVIGLFVGLLGAGGSILTTPLFVYVEGMEPVAAISSSLLVVMAASTFALVRHGIRGLIQWRTGFVFGLSGMLSAKHPEVVQRLSTQWEAIAKENGVIPFRQIMDIYYNKNLVMNAHLAIQ